MNLEVPVEQGGAGLGVLDTCLVLEELNYGCAGTTNAIAADRLATIPLLEAGSEKQKRRHLGQLTAEPAFAAFCITEPGPYLRKLRVHEGASRREADAGCEGAAELRGTNQVQRVVTARNLLKG